MNAFPKDSAIILVHGAWADGSCWSNIILPLQRHGLKVIWAPIPLEGAKVVGSFQGTGTGSFVGRGSTLIEGTVAGDIFRFNDARGTLNGEVTVSGDEMTGHGTFGIRPVAITLRRVEAALPPTSPPR